MMCVSGDEETEVQTSSSVTRLSSDGNYSFVQYILRP